MISSIFFNQTSTTVPTTTMEKCKATVECFPDLAVVYGTCAIGVTIVAANSCLRLQKEKAERIRRRALINGVVRVYDRDLELKSLMEQEESKANALIKKANRRKNLMMILSGSSVACAAISVALHQETNYSTRQEYGYGKSLMIVGGVFAGIGIWETLECNKQRKDALRRARELKQDVDNLLNSNQ
jgi:hypothetical protein